MAHNVYKVDIVQKRPPCPHYSSMKKAKGFVETMFIDDDVEFAEVDSILSITIYSKVVGWITTIPIQ